MVQKDSAVRGCGAAISQIRDQRIAHLLGHRQDAFRVGFGGTNQQTPIDPVKIVQAHSGCLFSAKAEAGEKHQDGVVTPPNGCSIGADLQQPIDFGFTQSLWQSGLRPARDIWDRRFQSCRKLALRNQKAQEGPDGRRCCLRTDALASRRIDSYKLDDFIGVDR